MSDQKPKHSIGRRIRLVLAAVLLVAFIAFADVAIGEKLPSFLYLLIGIGFWLFVAWALLPPFIAYVIREVRRWV